MLGWFDMMSHTSWAIYRPVWPQLPVALMGAFLLFLYPANKSCGVYSVSVCSSVVCSHLYKLRFLGNCNSHCHEILYTNSLYQGQDIAAKNGHFGQCLSVWETQVYLFVNLFVTPISLTMCRAGYQCLRRHMLVLNRF